MRAKKKLQLTHDIIGSANLDPDVDYVSTAKLSDLQSMVVFGLDKLHASESPDEGDPIPDITKLVQEVLQQRNKQGIDAWNSENATVDEELQENLYAFEGQDFSSRKRKRDEEVQIPSTSTQAVLESWVDKLRDLSDKEVKLVNGRTRSLDKKTEISEEYDAAKKARGEKKKLAKWESLGYTSLSVQHPGDIDGSMTADRGNVNFVFGDCTRPSIGNTESAIIFSITDDSGIWGNGGMFSALDRLSPAVRGRYEAAHAAGDLHLGDLHLVSVKGGPADDESNSQLYVGLGVVQSYNSRRKTPRSDISLPDLETCLRKATKSAATMSASIHMPRISSHPGQDRKEWYVIERLLRKYAGVNGIEIFIYYYRRNTN